MTTPTPELQRALEQLRREYAAKFPEDIRTLDACWEQLQRDWGCGVLDAFRRLLHKLCGSAGMYGFNAVSACACPLDLRLREYQQRASVPSAAELDAITAQLAQLKLRLAEAAEHRT